MPNLSRTLEVAVVADPARFKRGMGEAEQATGRFGKATAGMGKLAAVAGGAFGIGALVVGAKSVVGAAQDAQKSQQGMETQLKALNISYADHKSRIDDTIASTSKLSALDDEDLQQAFTRLLPAAGGVNKALDEMSLAADIARARHVSLESATALVTRANAGSAGALRKFGIAMVATTDNVDAARARIAEYKKSHDDLSPAMEASFQAEIKAAQARDKAAQGVANITKLQQTFKGAAEDYGKTGAAANERLGVAFENLQETIGKKVVPVLARLTEGLVSVIEWTEKNWPRLQQAIGPTLEKIRDTVERVVSGIQDAWENHGAEIMAVVRRVFGLVKDTVENAMKVIGGIVDVVMGVFTGDWSRAWDGVKKIFSGTWDEIKSVLSFEVDVLKTIASRLGSAIKDAILGALEGIGTGVWNLLKGIGSAITGGLSDVGGWGASLGGKLKDAAVGAVTGIGDAVWNVVDNIGSTISAAAATILGWGTGIGTKVKSAAVAGVTGIATAVWDIVNNIGSTIAGFAESILGWGTGVGAKVKSGAVSGVTGIATDVWHIVDNIGSTIAGFAASIVEWGSGVGNKVKSGAVAGVTGIATDVWHIVNNVASTIADNAAGIIEWGSGVGSKIKSGAVAGITGIATDVWHVIDNIPGLIAGFKDTIEGWGKSVVVHIKDGIVDAGDELWNGIKHIFSGLPGKVKALLKIGSPSRVFMEIGHDVVRGFVKGIENKAGDLTSAALGLVTGPLGAAAGAVGGAIGGALGVPGGGPGTPAANAALGRQMAAARGWTGQEWDALAALWNQESGWSQFAYNKDSGATGIPQSLPYTKMPRAAWLPFQGGQADPAAQIRWGLDYIAGRYGDPLGAWAHEKAFNWYGQGGAGIVSRPTIFGAGERGPEAVQITPLAQLNRGGGNTYHITITGPVYGANADELARGLRDQLRELDRRDTGGRVLSSTPALR